MKRATSSCLHFVAWALFCLSVSAQPEETRLSLPFNIGGSGFDTGIAVANAGDTSGSIELTLSQHSMMEASRPLSCRVRIWPCRGSATA